MSIIYVYLISNGLMLGMFFGIYCWTKHAFWVNLLLVFCLLLGGYISGVAEFPELILYSICPLILVNILGLMFLHRPTEANGATRYRVLFKLKKGHLILEDIRRGVSIIGAAGSGKTESVVFRLMQHFSQQQFCGIIHDYKHFELTEIAYPLFEKQGVDFRIIAFDQIFDRVNPIAPRYLQKEENVNEVARVLIENLLEQKEAGSTGSSKFFIDAAEGLMAGLIWKLKCSYPKYCTLPHLIALYQYLDTQSLIAFLSSNSISRVMADAFISGRDSERQTAGVRSTLANALKKMSTQSIFMVLTEDAVDLNVNIAKSDTVVAVVNNPKYETAYAPVIATIIHTMTKQMSVRGAKPSFLLMEEAPTIRLLNMHRIPATLRSYGISTVYVLQDKVQNDIMYGEKASRAILGNLSYQFFGKVNDPDTAKYYERFFELVKRKTTSISRGFNLNFDTRVTTGEREVAKIRAEVFFKLKPGGFVVFTDGQEQQVQFPWQPLEKRLPTPEKNYTPQDLQANFDRVFQEVKTLFKEN
ncbi:type IV secretory system conjugative DNA transfer family protein [Formosa sp. A9]|uniref:type IV secretory system conjugative DNA transfer family protein n=1 Tax=Formosa sp. A9 TaxID=3442641 RepID=UPI003EC0A676